MNHFWIRETPVVVSMNQVAKIRVESFQEERDGLIGVMYVTTPTIAVVYRTGKLILYLSLVFPCGPQLLYWVGDVVRLDQTSTGPGRTLRRTMGEL